MTTTVYLSLGTNVGDLKENLEKATRELERKVTVTGISSDYKTEPVGYKDQQWFLNRVLKGETDLKPEELLDFCQRIEKKMKRVKTIRFGPRIIDIDILLYDDLRMKGKRLEIPHPRMFERAFVLYPLFEIEPELIVGDLSLRDWMKDFKGENIEKIES
ncbi:MAG TPA: 2-amino-4-hydroxy-6-hydroxymethyldihydropteridine diphosphokinase [Eubacteriaceae bacterium]|nr:2-amino-4-hydroxy-6-hydroxymethyldihydropteridine diphosphokinase [Eubacteriaceae bacterium]